MESTTRNRPAQHENKTDSEANTGKPKPTKAVDAVATDAADAKSTVEQPFCAVPRYLDSAVIATPTASNAQSEQLNSSTAVTPISPTTGQNEANSTKNSPNSAQTASNTAPANADAKADGNTKSQSNSTDASKAAAGDANAKKPEEGKKDAENSQKLVDKAAKEAIDAILKRAQ